MTVSNADRFLDQMGKIAPFYLEEYYHRRTARKENRKNVFQFVTLAASLALMLVLSLFLLLPKVPTEFPYESNDMADTPSTEMIPPLPQNSIVFAGSLSDGKAEAIVSDPLTGKYLPMSYRLGSVLRDADEDTLFAFALYVSDSVDTEEYKLYSEKCGEAQEVLEGIAEKCTASIMAERSISREEARARTFSHPDFIAAREIYRKTVAEYQAAWLSSLYEDHQNAVTVLEAMGFTPVYDATDPQYHAYLYEVQSIAVMAGTKEQIMTLARNCDGMYYLYAAMDNAQLYGQTDFYTSQEVFLPEDSSITEELLQKYALAKGETIDVVINIAYYGQEGITYESREAIHEATLAILGMTEEEFDRCNDMETIQRYLTEKRRLLFHSDYHEDLAERVLLSEELTEIREWAGCFFASLTYERALELSQEYEIAYIQSLAAYENRGGEFNFGEVE